MSLLKLSILERLPALIRTPNYERLEALTQMEFTLVGPTNFKGYYSVPMKSGKVALIKYLGTETPWDPGDQHFHSWGFIKYLEAPNE